MIRGILLLSGAILAAAISPGGAVAAVATPEAAVAAVPGSASAKDELNQLVCERQEVLGSRLASKRVCMTRSQWADKRATDRQDIERAQTQRGTAGTH